MYPVTNKQGMQLKGGFLFQKLTFQVVESFSTLYGIQNYTIYKNPTLIPNKHNVLQVQPHVFYLTFLYLFWGKKYFKYEF